MPPVEDHVVHQSVITTGKEPYGCNSSNPRAKGYWIQERQYRKDGTYVMRDRFIENLMSTDCRNFYLWYKDLRCQSCKRGKDREYAMRMSSL